MALGGGTFTAQNKILPGSYINVVSALRANTGDPTRGVAALALNLPYSPAGVFEVTNETLTRDALKLFATSPETDTLRPIRDALKNARKIYVYNTNDTSTKASNTYATAKYAGEGGNNISVRIAADVDNTNNYVVSTLVGTAVVDEQSVAKSGKTTALAANDYVDWKTEVTLAETASTPLAGGVTKKNTGTTSEQNALNAFEAYTFNVIAIDHASPAVHNMVRSYVHRRREEQGVKIQGVVYNTDADEEGIINVVTAVDDETSPHSLIFWVAGAEAGCALNASLTNRIYDGEYVPVVNETQSELEAYIQDGKFALHRVGDDVRVLMDINTLKTVTEEKGEIFKENQTIRVVDDIANDIASIFSSKYIGMVQNNATGRALFKADIVSHHNDLQDANAIEGFTSDDVSVSAGSGKGDVIVTDAITIVGTMTKLYMTVYVS